MELIVTLLLIVGYGAAILLGGLAAHANDKRVDAEYWRDQYKADWHRAYKEVSRISDNYDQSLRAMESANRAHLKRIDRELDEALNDSYYPPSYHIARARQLTRP